MLIVEGVDGSGKTTLCRALVTRLAHLGYVYNHFTRLPVGFDYYWGYVGAINPRAVQDRLHMSEPVYSRARGEASPLTPEIYRLVDARLRGIGAYTVVLLADDKLVEARYKRAEQMYDLTKTLTAAQGFRDIIERRTVYLDVDYDRAFYLNEDRPYVTDADVDAVLEGYLARQALVSRVAERRPPCL